jgi:hypothetical protein
MTINPGLGSVSNFIRADGIFKRSNSNFWNKLPNNYSGWEVYFYDIAYNYIKVKLSTNQYNAGIEKMIIILEYTK